jgi:hypothetical protein
VSGQNRYLSFATYVLELHNHRIWMKKWLFVALLAVLFGLGPLRHIRSGEDTAIRARSLDLDLRLTSSVATMIARSCADCHSQGTRWPWYSHLPRVGSDMHLDVSRARAVMNFSEWSARERAFGPPANDILMVACADLRSRRMPLPKYLWLHPESRPTESEIEDYCAWAKQRVTQATDQRGKLTSSSQLGNLPRLTNH